MDSGSANVFIRSISARATADQIVALRHGSGAVLIGGFVAL